ncbi:lysozyme inhibitor LprI family protein [Phaeovulum vinaykumarii]|uniref:Lysozyme inhibitor LprI-like N-terminal domain-containing protein n=1 Tax=Phaeovulum vinaykumarii TaxID=407234 RepID=A0A1N7L7D6_9RHOB|nr:lysozyme inhibitor LprI family protein [Phaeovulum vinaykumarii]SIS69755.1 Protein of unknown function [Phaeovulum vinaykumarii]SOB99330.1 uncharacterized protein DUF1311 [Phaeovulum vinaykumarii]
MRLTLALVATLFAAPALAQGYDFSPDATLECMEKQTMYGADIACVGESARACFGKIKGRTVTDIAACQQAEAEYWKTRMDAAFEKLVEMAKVADEKFAGNPDEPPRAKMADDLAHEQDNWNKWRETRCWVEAMMRRGTPYRMTAAANCTMKHTAERAMFLESAVKYMEKH